MAQIHGSSIRFILIFLLYLGLDDKQMTRLLGLELHDEDEEVKTKPEEVSKPVRTRKTSVLEYSPLDLSKKVEEQAQNNVWHRFVQGNFILKQGLVDKRKVNLHYLYFF